jgi:hypothetical protein
VGNIWSRQYKILAADGAGSDFFGHSVSIYNNTAMIGAHGDDDKDTDAGMNKLADDVRSVHSYIIYNMNIYIRFSLYVL